uniref:NifQ protein involved in the incorporation of molybdenum into nitrogenase n=1 Tax=Magnetococcus massalia (strain MO-1) TaxID=451514 RepID=A0A1S7LDH5_MAGMO|nr:NifQ protein involved in the incorporation of molybdenum into nitrogenase [Candidatus Magnetococcus massalia]
MSLYTSLFHDSVAPPFSQGMAPLINRLRVHQSGLPNSAFLLEMLASSSMGEGQMPRYLGLDRESFGLFMQHHFPSLDMRQFDFMQALPLLDSSRMDEVDELLQLFLEHAGPDGELEKVLIARILAAGCMGQNHLWEDLGLWSRTQLSSMILTNFPALAHKNDRNMKWKRFFYKQLCEREGVYTCRAPSCAVCGDYSQCFGPEE